MTTSEKNKRLNQAIKQHEELLNKELSYSKDLQNQEAIERHMRNIAKVKGMMK